MKSIIDHEYYDNGQMKSEKRYGRGDLESEIQYYKNGNVSIEISWGQGVEAWTCFYENGQKKAKGQCGSRGPIARHIHWYENGQIASEYRYSERGNLEGRVYEWYENGQKKMEGYYWYNHKKGLWTWWDEEGNVIRTKTYLRWLKIFVGY